MHWDPANYKYQELTEAIIQAFYEVYNELGHGFLESVYEEAIHRVLRGKAVEFNVRVRYQCGSVANRLGIFGQT